MLRFKRVNEDEAVVTVAPGHTIERATEWRRLGGTLPVFRCSCGWSKSSAYDKTNRAAERHAEEVISVTKRREGDSTSGLQDVH